MYGRRVCAATKCCTWGAAVERMQTAGEMVGVGGIKCNLVRNHCRTSKRARIGGEGGGGPSESDTAEMFGALKLAFFMQYCALDAFSRAGALTSNGKHALGAIGCETRFCCICVYLLADSGHEQQFFFFMGVVQSNRYCVGMQKSHRDIIFGYLANAYAKAENSWLYWGEMVTMLLCKNCSLVRGANHSD